MKISATIQARLASTRLPGKVLRPILGKPMLELQIERLRQSKFIDEVIIATTNLEKDDPIIELADRLNVPYYRGSEDDVLGRIVNTLKEFDVDVHAEFTGDHPLEDPVIIDSILDFYVKNSDKYDYVSNYLKTTYPPGIGFAVYPAKILYDAEKHAKDMKLREHVGIHIYQHPERYRIHNLEAPPEYNYPEMYIEVDTAEDFEVVSTIFKNLYPKNKYFGLPQIINFMHENKELIEKNKNVARRWKEFRWDNQDEV